METFFSRVLKLKGVILQAQPFCIIWIDSFLLLVLFELANDIILSGTINNLPP